MLTVNQKPKHTILIIQKYASLHPNTHASNLTLAGRLEIGSPQ